MRIVLQAAVDRFNGIGCFQTHSQVIKNPQPMEREGLFHPLLEAVQGGLIHQFQARFERVQRRLGRRVGRFAIGRLHLATDAGLLALGQVGHDVLALVILAALYAGMPLEHRHHRLVEPLAAVDDDQQSSFVLQTTLNQIGQEATADALILGGSLLEILLVGGS